MLHDKSLLLFDAVCLAQLCDGCVQVLPGVAENSGTPEHPLFFLSFFRSCSRRSGVFYPLQHLLYVSLLLLFFAVPDPAREKLLSDEGTSSGGYSSPHAEDLDVAAERARVVHGHLPITTAIEIKHLFKVCSYCVKAGLFQMT